MNVGRKIRNTADLYPGSVVFYQIWNKLHISHCIVPSNPRNLERRLIWLPDIFKSTCIWSNKPDIVPEPAPPLPDFRCGGKIWGFRPVMTSIMTGIELVNFDTLLRVMENTFQLVMSSFLHNLTSLLFMYSAVRYVSSCPLYISSTVQYSAVQYSTEKSSAVQCSPV